MYWPGWSPPRTTDRYPRPVVARFRLGGGIGSGKSTVARILRDQGAVVLEADREGHAVLAAGTPEHAAVAGTWPTVIRSDGTIDRPALGRIVFADPVALAALEAITWPEIARRLRREADRHTGAVVIVEVPVLRDLMGEGWPWIVVDAPREIRLARTMARPPHPSEDEVHAVMARQPSRGEWLAAASWVIDNSSDETDLVGECDRLWRLIGPLAAAEG